MSKKDKKEFGFLMKAFGKFCTFTVPGLIAICPILFAALSNTWWFAWFLIVTIPIGLLTQNTIRIIFDD